MTRIIHGKDAVIYISQLQKRNSELEKYVSNLEKRNHNGVQAEYKEKPLLENQNKTRIMKQFLTRAEIALWFSKIASNTIQLPKTACEGLSSRCRPC